MGQPPTLPDEPGPAPRRVGLASWLNRLPAFLQMGVIATPICALAAALWLAFDPGKDSLIVVLTVVWALPLAWGWALLYRRRMVTYPAFPALVIGHSPGEGGMMFATYVHYRYAVGGREYEGEHMVSDARHLGVGTLFWVLVSPTDPSRSIGWL